MQAWTAARKSNRHCRRIPCQYIRLYMRTNLFTKRTIYRAYPSRPHDGESIIIISYYIILLK